MQRSASTKQLSLANLEDSVTVGYGVPVLICGANQGLS